MKTAIFVSIAALCATMATAIPSAEPVHSATADLGAAATFDDFIGYYCSIPGNCDEPASLAARSAEPGWTWRWNICRLPGQPCTQKVKRSAEPGWTWRWNICRLPGQPCTQKRSVEAVTGFPGAEALEDDATEEERALADKYKLAAEILFG